MPSLLTAPLAAPPVDTPSLGAPWLAARALTGERGARVLFTDLAFDLRAGELLWVRGRNGRGKTSLLRLAAGLGAPVRGQLLFDGVERSPHRPVVFVGHANGLKEDLHVDEALTFLQKVHGGRRDEAALSQALDDWGLLAHRHAPVRTLSQGQRRRLALARLSLERRATLWALDEPFDALDADGAERLNQVLAVHLARGGSVLITGHQMALSADLPCRELDLDDRAD